METRAGKHKRINDESKRIQKKRTFRFSTTHREKRRQRLSERNEQNKAPSRTTLYDLPLEMLDIILQKSYLHWILNSPTKQRDKDVIRYLISVDVCFNRRITRQRFKKTIWRYLKNFYGETKKRCAIIRINKNYLLENIQPNDELIASLLTLNCITAEQSDIIQRQRSTREKNAELLCFVESFDEIKFLNFVKCLRHTNNKTVARIIENGGGVIKLELQTCGAKCTTSMETHLLHQKIEDLRNRTKPRSHQTDRLISQLMKEGIEILNSHLNRQTVVIWIWCRLQSALEYVQRLYESNQLRNVFFENIQPSVSMVINIDTNQFKKTIVVYPISINFIQRIVIRGTEYMCGVTKLRNEIYVLCRSRTSAPSVIRVFEDRHPFRFQRNIEINQIKVPCDIGSSEKENCLYISDREEKCVWKIEREADQQRIIKWLTTDYPPYTLSVSSDGQLLLVSDSSSILLIYGSDAELIRAIKLPRDIKRPRHAVETSIGNFVILHSEGEEKKKKRKNIEEEDEEWMEEVRDSSSSGRNSIKFEKKKEEQEEVDGKGKEGKTVSSGSNFVVSELTRDGRMIISRFIPLNETQELNYPRYLSLDSDDQVFVADTWNDRVILLKSDLKWHRIICPTMDEKEEMKNRYPSRLSYDEEKKQLIVGGYLEVNVFT